MAQLVDLQAAIEAAERGDQSTAAALLAQVLRSDPGSEIAWWWMARCVDDPAHRAECLRRVVALNPHRDDARQALAALQQPATRPPASSAFDQHPIQLSESEQDAKARSPMPAALEPHAKPEVVATLPPPEASLPGGPKAQPVRTQRPRAGLSVMGGLGLLLIVAACGLPVLYVLLSGIWTRWTTSTPVPAPTAVAALATATPPSSPSAQPTSHATPTEPPATSTPRPTATLSPDEIDDLRGEARELMFQEQFDAALVAWDRVLAAAPRDADAHYRRAQVYLDWLSGETYRGDYLDHLTRGLDEINQAIALGPVNGDFYLMRAWLLHRLAYAQDTRANFDVYGQASVKDLRQAVILGNHDTGSAVDEAIYLMGVGRCDEGLAVARAREADAAAEEPQHGITYALAIDELCLGQFNAALSHIDATIAASSHWDYPYTRAIILYERGDLAAAAAELDASIQRSPSYCGCRYFLRALIRLDQGRTQEAADDLDAGYGQTWDHTGTYLYVRGRLALQAGDESGGWDLIRQAEATLERRYEQMRLRILRELTAAGIAPLEQVATATFSAAEAAVLPAPMALPDGRTAPNNVGLRVDLATGIGPLLSYATTVRAYHAATDTVLPAGVVALATIHLQGVSRSAMDEYVFKVWDQRQGGWRSFTPAANGSLDLVDPDAFVSPTGDLFFLIVHDASEDRRVNWIGVTLTIRQADGGLVRVGLAP